MFQSLVWTISILLLISNCFKSTRGEDTANTLSNPYLIGATFGGHTQYLVFHSHLRTDHAEARSRCHRLGGELADVDSIKLLTYLSNRIANPSFIGGFEGGDYTGSCLGLYPGGAVAIPENGCQELLDSICEVPVYGMGSIHFDGNASPTEQDKTMAKNDMHLEEGGVKSNNLHVVPHGFFRKAQAVAQQLVSTTTINIYGSIATNPALPCCQCCGVGSQ